MTQLRVLDMSATGVKVVHPPEGISKTLTLLLNGCHLVSSPANFTQVDIDSKLEFSNVYNSKKSKMYLIKEKAYNIAEGGKIKKKKRRKKRGLVL